MWWLWGNYLNINDNFTIAQMFYIFSGSVATYFNASGPLFKDMPVVTCMFQPIESLIETITKLMVTRKLAVLYVFSSLTFC